MFGYVKKIKEYVKLGSSMEELNKEIMSLAQIIDNSRIPNDSKDIIVRLAIAIRKEIFDRMDEYDWSLEGPIRVKSISAKNIPLFQAKTVISAKIRTLALQLGDDTYKLVGLILDK